MKSFKIRIALGLLLIFLIITNPLPSDFAFYSKADLSEITRSSNWMIFSFYKLNGVEYLGLCSNFFKIEHERSVNKESNKISLSDSIESGRQFIDASLKGNYERAEKYMLADSANSKYLESLKDFYQKMSSAEKEGYKDAIIIINPSEAVNDSTTIINYTNTYKNKSSKIKVVKVKKEWKVDFKYTFTGDL